MRLHPPTATPIDWKVMRAALRADAGDVSRFRAALAAYLGADACFPAASGRAALYLLLTTLRNEMGGAGRSEVVLPAYTCPSLGKVTLTAGLTPRFVDVSPYTLSFNSAELATAVGARTLAVVCVHPFGIPHPIAAAQQIAQDAGAVLIEDAAQAMGAKLGGRYVGTTARFGLFSLGPGKPMSTGGGGFVCAADAAASDLLRRAWDGLPPATGGRASWPRCAWLCWLRRSIRLAGGWRRWQAQRVGESEASWGFSLRGLTPAQASADWRCCRSCRRSTARRAHGAALMAALAGIDGVHLPAQAAAARCRGAQRTSEPVYLRLPVILDSERCEAAHRALLAGGYGAGRMYRWTMAEFFPAYADGAYRRRTGGAAAADTAHAPLPLRVRCAAHGRPGRGCAPSCAGRGAAVQRTA